MLGGLTWGKHREPQGMRREFCRCRIAADETWRGAGVGRHVGRMGDFEDELENDLKRGIAGKPDELPQAAWADVEALGAEWRYQRSGVFLGGRRIGGKPAAIGVNDDRHVMTVAGSRAGKGVSLIVPNLLLYEGSVLVIDPKGELARKTSRYRSTPREQGGLGQNVVVLDPFGASLGDCKTPEQAEALRARFGGYNPLDEMDVTSPFVVDDAAELAEGLITPSEHGDRHWTDAARRLLKAVILFVLSQYERHERTLVTVRRVLMLDAPEIQNKARELGVSADEALFTMMARIRDFDGVLAGEGNALLSMLKGERELASILSVARTQTEFIDSPGLRDLLSKSSFHLGDLKREGVTVYLCLPASSMGGSHANWLRVMITRALTAFERTPGKPAIPVLMLLDEFSVLGYMRSIEAAAGQIAGHGVKLWTVLQDLGQIKRLYKDSWETFVGNSGVVTFFGNSDAFTLEYISKKLGRSSLEILRPSGATASAILGGARTTREEVREAALMEPHEAQQVLAREKRRLLVLPAGGGPLMVERVIYHEPAAKAFAGRWDP